MINIQSVYLECFHSFLYAALALGYNCRFYISLHGIYRWNWIINHSTHFLTLPGLCNKLTLSLHNIAFYIQIKPSSFPTCLFPQWKGLDVGILSCRLLTARLYYCSVLAAVTACYKEEVVNSSHSFSHFTVHRSYWKLELFSFPLLCQLK